MGCSKGKRNAKDRPENYRCRKCGAVCRKKKRLCKPVKIR